jgi:hypothetical protein
MPLKNIGGTENLFKGIIKNSPNSTKTQTYRSNKLSKPPTLK